MEQVICLSERDDRRDREAALRAPSKDVERKIGRLVAALEADADLASVAAKRRELEKRKTAIADELVSVQPVPRLAPEVIEDRLAEWTALAAIDDASARRRTACAERPDRVYAR